MRTDGKGARGATDPSQGEALPAAWPALFEAYCHAIDARDLEALRGVFVPDCEVRYGEVEVRGLDALREYLSEQLARFSDTRHSLGRVTRLGERRGDWARARIEAWHRFPERDGRRRPDLTLHGHFDSRFVETPWGWRIAVHLGAAERRVDGSGEGRADGSGAGSR